MHIILSIIFITLGYLSGSLLFARLTSRLFNKPEILNNSKDRNPGTANAFMYGGFWCGTVTLIGDILKGTLPIYLYRRLGGDLVTFPILTALVIAAPVIGHAFPLFFGFCGGKGIAVTFGCLIGLLPDIRPLATLVVLFILFSTILRITPHFHRTIATYLVAMISMIFLRCELSILIGFLLITLTVCLRMHMSTEERKKPEVKLLWMR